MKLNLFCACVVASAGMAAGASANTVFNNPFSFAINNGDCSWSTTCAAVAGRGDDFAAQEFTLTQSVVITSASFVEFDQGVGPTSINWGFIEADGPGGSPGTILQAGTDDLSSLTLIQPDLGYLLEQGRFSVGPMALGPGTYYFALQGVSSTFYTFLGAGVATSGAYETHDGGVTWSPGYEGFNSVAIGLYGVPEPASWALMLLGFGLVGGALRRRSSTAVV